MANTPPLASDDVNALEAALSPLETVPIDAVLGAAKGATPFVLCDGWAGLVRTMASGKRQIVALFLPGDVVGLDTATAPLGAGEIVALSAVRLRRLSAQGRALVALRPQLVKALAAHNLQHQARLQDQVFRIGVLAALGRVAHLLGELDTRLKLAAGDDRSLVPVTQAVLGQVLGISLVHVNRTLQVLASQRLAWLDRNRLVVPDDKALEAVWQSAV
ncbi:Crp/Fnr family transcriptional regulator [Caulobacter endophyticus]|uniref:HTH crp-type domain-containing protein n=1 Tax=Caulobacter endophyticus TaxID=2172652 RepID=A0A2T9JI91_9CAUL|nr:Crp/Fnr family transcriptional regulator [Caulobacter endophyticus]PVM83389.1 hypothetical protein DDF67_20835 [Caulobacter endophyticus]